MWAKMLRAFQIGKALNKRRRAVELDAVIAGALPIFRKAISRNSFGFFQA